MDKEEDVYKRQEQGRTDSPDSTSLYVPSIGLIVAGDVVYNLSLIHI